MANSDNRAFFSAIPNAENPSHTIDRRVPIDTSMMVAAVSVSGRATCTRRAVGCLLVKGTNIVTTGYNGAPRGTPHCLDVGCLIDEGGHCMRCVHAEANACLKVSDADGVETAYCTDRPCLSCLKLMIQKGITRVMYWRHYEDKDSDRYLKEVMGAKFVTCISLEGPGISLSRAGSRLSTLLSRVDSEMRGLAGLESDDKT